MTRHPHVVHWDAVAPRVRRVGPIGALWSDLGAAAGSVAVGLRRIRVDPGARSTPPHRHGAEEEIVYVLAGTGLSWQDGRAYALGAGDCVVHRPGAEVHTVVGGEEGIDVLVFGQRLRTEASELPRAGVLWFEDAWVEPAGGAHPWQRDADAAPLPVPVPEPERPPRIVALDALEPVPWGRGRSRVKRRDLGRAAGSVATGLTHLAIAAGHESAPPHCHSMEEEIFVVLAGAGTVHLGEAAVPVRAGSVVARPAGTKIAHHFEAGPDGELVLLAYGTRLSGDIVYYPRSGKVSLRGVGVIGRIEPLDYWDGEA